VSGRGGGSTSIWIDEIIALLGDVFVVGEKEEKVEVKPLTAEEEEELIQQEIKNLQVL